MTGKITKPNIQTRRELFDYLQSQMRSSYMELREKQKLNRSLTKSYIFEVDVPEPLSEIKTEKALDTLKNIFQQPTQNKPQVEIIPKAEDGFFEIFINSGDSKLTLFVDAITDSRFWFGYSTSDSADLDNWLRSVLHHSTAFDFVWLWPTFLEQIQSRGIPRGFGLDYDYRKFEKGDTEGTSYLKMQLWGGQETSELYDLLRQHPKFKSKVVLAKVRFKEILQGEDQSGDDLFALQDAKYTGKFTTRGTDFQIHLNTLQAVREEYKQVITGLEEKYSIRWREEQNGGTHLEGFPIHFFPQGFDIPVKLLYENIFDGTDPFRLLGFTSSNNDFSANLEVVDLHTGGELSISLFPDVITVYLPEGTCGNTIARLYTNLQHSLDVRFRVEADNGQLLFE